MERYDRLTQNDELIRRLTEKIRERVRINKVKKNWRNEWFSSSQLNHLRWVYERHGYEIARIFQTGKSSPRDNRYKIQENKTLLEILDKIKESKIEIEIGSYILGNLNQLLEQEEIKGGVRNG